MPRSPRRATTLSAALLVAASALAGCSAGASPNPSTACNGADEQSYAGFYRDLEGLLPRQVGSQPLQQVRSGRYCSSRTLGSLEKVGIHELEFAGGALPDPKDRAAGLGLVVYRASGLTLDQLADAQANGAGGTQDATGITAQRATISGRSGIQIDVSVQSGPEMIFVWPEGAPGVFDAVTGVSATQSQIEAAVAAFASVQPAPASTIGGTPEPSGSG